MTSKRRRMGGELGAASPRTPRNSIESELADSALDDSTTSTTTTPTEAVSRSSGGKTVRFSPQLRQTRFVPSRSSSSPDLLSDDSVDFEQRHSPGAISVQLADDDVDDAQSELDADDVVMPVGADVCAHIDVKSAHAVGLLKVLNQMRKTESLCDYEIIVNGESFHCHKVVLASTSDFFSIMLNGSMKESRMNYVELKAFVDTKGVALLLDFIYTGELFLSFENVVGVLEAASRLQVRQLLQLCSDFLVENLTTLNCVSVLRLADTYSLAPVAANAHRFLIENLVDLYQNSREQFHQLSAEQLTSVLANCEELSDALSELDLFLMVVKWVEGATPRATGSKYDSERVKHVAGLMRHVRFMCMSPEELADFVEPVEFMLQVPECNAYLMQAYKYHALPRRQPLIASEQARLRDKEKLIAVGETNVFILNERKDEWEPLCSAPLDENYPYPFSALTINNYLYVLGAKRVASEEYRACFRFSPRSLEWTEIAPLLHDRSRFGSAVVGERIYIFGGFEGFKRSNRIYLNTIEAYSIEEDAWTQLSADGPIISCMACCSHGTRIFFGGGKNQNWSKQSDFFSLDVETTRTTRLASMLTARTSHQLAVVNGLVYVLGGFDDAGNGILSMEAYDMDADQWSVITSVPGIVSKTWPQCLGFVSGRFYISVFQTPLNPFKIKQNAYYYDVHSNLWSDAPVINEKARYCLTCSLSFPHHIYNFDTPTTSRSLRPARSSSSSSTLHKQHHSHRHHHHKSGAGKLMLASPSSMEKRPQDYLT